MHFKSFLLPLSLLLLPFLLLSRSHQKLCASAGENCGVLQEGGKSCCSGHKCVSPADGRLGAKGKCEVCAVKGQACGSKFEGQTECCDDQVCSYQSGLDGAPGVCVDAPKEEKSLESASLICAAAGERCGVPQEGGKNCCSGHKCVYQNDGRVGAQGSCEVCAAKGQACGHKFEGQTECCDGQVCSFRGGLMGAPGVCVDAPKENSIESAFLVCASAGEHCGATQEGGNSCCSGHKCVFEDNSLLGAKGKCEVCAVKGKACGHKFEGQTECCDGQVCSFRGGLMGAPGVCVDAPKEFTVESAFLICASVGEHCGSTKEGGKECCSGHKCVYANDGRLGARGKCEVCAVKGQSCGHKSEGQLECCSNQVCSFRGGLLGAPGVCVDVVTEENAVESSFLVCASAGEHCGVAPEGGKECCSGHKCVYENNGLVGSKGRCEVCAAKGQSCGHKSEGQLECCSDQVCSFKGTLLGAPGVCVDAPKENAVQTSFLVCASAGEHCGVTQEGGNECCSGHKCVYDNNGLIGSKGRCEVCAAKGQSCGHKSEGQLECCSNQVCSFRGSLLGAPGVCVDALQENAVESRFLICASAGEHCGITQEGGKECCSGHKCVYENNELMGAKGKCEICAAKGQSCGHKSEGQLECCSGQVCSFKGSLLGAPGVCVDASKDTAVVNNLLICASAGEHCGSPQEGGKNCCSGHKCVFDGNGLIGAKGKCEICAVKGKSCGHKSEGQLECCSGQVCSFRGGLFGAPGVCVDAPKENENLLCASTGESCGKTEEGQKECCEGKVCTWRAGDLLGAPGSCVEKIHNVVLGAVEVNVCRNEGEKCGNKVEGGAECCEGLECFWESRLLGAAGRCYRK